MMDVVEMIAAVILAAAAVIAVVWFIKATPARRRELINQLLYALAVEAERLYGGKTGQVKKKQVIAWFYERYRWLSAFVDEATLGEWIDEVVASMNAWMQSNPVGAANLMGE